jgi:hypothetical protein
MTGRTLFFVAYPAVLALAAGQSLKTVRSANPVPPPDLAARRLSSGKTPTTAEYVALTATCQHQSKGAVDSCLATLGLKKAP